jgi:hypothetical protein
MVSKRTSFLRHFFGASPRGWQNCGYTHFVGKPRNKFGIDYIKLSQSLCLSPLISLLFLTFLSQIPVSIALAFLAPCLLLKHCFKAAPPSQWQAIFCPYSISAAKGTELTTGPQIPPTMLQEQHFFVFYFGTSFLGVVLTTWQDPPQACRR